MKKVIRLLFQTCDDIGPAIAAVVIFLGLSAGIIVTGVVFAAFFYEFGSWVALSIYLLLLLVVAVVACIRFYADDPWTAGWLKIQGAVLTAVLWPMVLLTLIAFSVCHFLNRAIISLRDWAFNDKQHSCE